MKAYFIQIILLFSLLMCFNTRLISQNEDINFIGGSITERDTIETIILEILNGCSKSYHQNTSLSSIKKYFNYNSFQKFSEHINKKYFYPDVNYYSGVLITNPDNKYEVHGLNMKLIRPEKNALIPHKHITFILNQNFLIEDFYFAPEKHHFQDVLQFGKVINNDEISAKVTLSLEELRTAYIEKDINKIGTAFSDDILIIAGFIPTEEHRDTLKRFVHYTKAIYLKRLEKLFSENEKIEVEFSEIEVKSHPFAHKVFGIEVKQKWTSDYYEDTGYIFMMVDFFDEKNPLFHVRIWQPGEF